MRIYLVRHAEAAPGEPDALRRLTPHGRTQARALGKSLAAEGVEAPAVVSSPLLRARETADEIARAVGATASPDERLAPGATADDVRAAVAGKGERVIVVAHQPDCGRVAATLQGGSEPRFPTAGLVVIELS